MSAFGDGRLKHNAEGGYYALYGPVPEYQWFVDMLALKYGAENIRVAVPENFGRVLKVAVYCLKGDKEFGFAIPMRDEDPDGGNLWDIKEKMFEFLHEQGLPREIPPVEEWERLPERKPR